MGTPEPLPDCSRAARAQPREGARASAVRRMVASAGAALALLVPTSCGSDPGSDGRPVVVATTAMVGDVATALGAGHFGVTTLLGSGVDPHLYRPNRDDVARLLGADLVLTNGLHLEGRMGDTLGELATAQRRVVAFAELLLGEADPSLAPLSDPGAPGAAHDPHVWMDPLRWAHAAKALAPALVAALPEWRRETAGREVLEVALPSFVATAEALTEFARVAFATIPPKQRVLVTAHDAFRYLGDRFGLEVIGLQGLSTESEAGVRRIEELVDLLVTRRVPAVFVETSVPDRAVKALVEGARARGLEVAIGGELYSDAMGAPGTPEGTYVGMFAHNVATITRGLGGHVPGGSFEIWRSVAGGTRGEALAEDAPGPAEGGRR